MDTLIDGYRRFRKSRSPEVKTLYSELAEKGQSPQYLVIACCDSRVDPATIFDAGPGELFVIRNIANIVPPYEPSGGHHGTSAAISFAVLALQVKAIVVLGHAGCGGISSLLTGQSAADMPFVGDWMDLIRPVLLQVPAGRHDRQTNLERAAVLLSLERLTSFPFVAERLAAKTLALHGARFGIASGVLEIFDNDTKRFVAVE